jgi:hypothetical protein
MTVKASINAEWLHWPTTLVGSSTLAFRKVGSSSSYTMPDSPFSQSLGKKHIFLNYLWLNNQVILEHQPNNGRLHLFEIHNTSFGEKRRPTRRSSYQDNHKSM